MAATVQITFTVSDDGLRHVSATGDGDCATDVLQALDAVLYAFATGKETYIRVRPEAVSERDFDTKKMSHRGWVRFSYLNSAGVWHDRADYDSDTGFKLMPLAST